MLLPGRDGIKCDHCGKEFRSKFVYYSYDCHKVSVDISRMETRKEKATNVDGSIIEFDVCEECHNKYADKLMEIQK